MIDECYMHEQMGVDAFGEACELKWDQFRNLEK